MAIFTGQTKDSSSWTDSSKHASAQSNQSKAVVMAENGQYYGFGAFTYSGGQSLTPTVPHWGNQTKD